MSTELSRRAFIGATAGAGLAVAGCGFGSGGDDGAPAPRRAAAKRPLDPRDWNSVRAQFELDPDYLHFTTYVLGAHAAPVREAIERHRRGFDRNPRMYLEENEGAMDSEMPAAVARFIGSAPEQIALTDSTTMGLAIVYSGFRLGERDEVLTSVHDHYATHEALRMRAERSGARVRQIELYPPERPETASADAIVAAVRDGITASTRLVALTWVHSSSGVRLPVRRIADEIARVNRRRPARRRVWLAVDGVHGFGAEPLAIEDFGADIFVAGCHKWLFGPRGTGFLWATPDAWEQIEPLIASFDLELYIAWMEGREPAAPPGRSATPGGFHSFEHRWALIEALEFAGSLDTRRVAERTHAFAARLREGLGAIGGVELRTPAGEDVSAGIVCFELPGRDPYELVMQLQMQHHVIASVTPYSLRFLRIGPTYLNTEGEVDEVVRAVGALA
jgi:selenocysteine lyase/cysteine desulfurase